MTIGFFSKSKYLSDPGVPTLNCINSLPVKGILFGSPVESDITIESPYKVATFYTHEDVTIDIEDDVTVTVDEGCTLLAINI